MNRIIGHENIELDAKYTVDFESGKLGLILESRGSQSNIDYNDAFELILERLQGLQIEYIYIYLVSLDSKKVLPNIEDRVLKIDDSSKINLNGAQMYELRKSLGGYMASIKADDNSKGGNPTKRILFHHPLFTKNDWVNIAQGNELKVSFLNDLVSSTLSKSTVEIERIHRKAYVKEMVLLYANGICELCSNNAPFITNAGKHYLEVHHVIPLTNGGPDSETNTVALCPNCHRAIHHSIEKDMLNEILYVKNSRLLM